MAGFNHFPQVAAALKPQARQAIKKTAFEIQLMAQAACPVDTGFLKNSIYTVTVDGSTYGEAGAPPRDSYLLPEVQLDDDLTAYVAVGANYGIYVELGTRFMPAQPFFYPAVKRGNDRLDAALSAMAKQLEDAGS